MPQFFRIPACDTNMYILNITFVISDLSCYWVKMLTNLTIQYKALYYLLFLFYQDWEYLLNSDYHKNIESHPLAKALRLDPLEAKFPKDNPSHNHCLDSTTLLFPHIPVIFCVLHLIYEELKLNCLMSEGIRSLVVLLVQLARWDLLERNLGQLCSLATIKSVWNKTCKQI